MDFLERGTSSANLVTLKLFGGLRLNPNCPCAIEWSPCPLIQKLISAYIEKLWHSDWDISDWFR